MKDLYFVDPSFNKNTLNLTVRRGDKWKNYVGDVRIINTSTNEVINTGKIVYSENIVFNQLSDRDLVLEHGEDCRTVEGLLEVLQDIYESFSIDEEV